MKENLNKLTKAFKKLVGGDRLINCKFFHK